MRAHLKTHREMGSTTGFDRNAGARGLALPALWLLILGACASTPMYAPCDESRDCEGPADRCYRLRFTRTDGTEGDGTLCSKRCDADADCPGGGTCLALAGDPEGTFICFEPCAGDVCYEGHACTAVDGASTDAICLPD